MLPKIPVMWYILFYKCFYKTRSLIYFHVKRCAVFAYKENALLRVALTASLASFSCCIVCVYTWTVSGLGVYWIQGEYLSIPLTHFRCACVSWISNCPLTFKATPPYRECFQFGFVFVYYIYIWSEGMYVLVLGMFIYLLSCQSFVVKPCDSRTMEMCIGTKNWLLQGKRLFGSNEIMQDMWYLWFSSLKVYTPLNFWMGWL